MNGLDVLRTALHFSFYLDLPDLNLQGGQVLQDLKVLGLVLEGVQVALDGLGVVALRAVQEAVHVPAYVTALANDKQGKTIPGTR